MVEPEASIAALELQRTSLELQSSVDQMRPVVLKKLARAEVTAREGADFSDALSLSLSLPKVKGSRLHDPSSSGDSSSNVQTGSKPQGE